MHQKQPPAKVAVALLFGCAAAEDRHSSATDSMVDVMIEIMVNVRDMVILRNNTLLH
ncbi:MAG: hypothetical protein PsegKO_27080 [Pseudohongiellaceae bacterium]